MATHRCIVHWLASCCLLAAISGLDNSKGRSPPLAWSSWNWFDKHTSEEIILQTGQALIDTGLAALGFDQVNIDSGYLSGRDASGRLVVHADRYPHGMRYVADRLHAMDLKLGVYTDISGHTCGNGPGTGSLGHYAQDAHTFAEEWRADYVKVDFCGPSGYAPCAANATDPSCVSAAAAPQYAAFAAFRDALNATGRPVYLSICPHRPADADGTARPYLPGPYGVGLIYAPPAEWNAAERHALANSLLYEYDNTNDAWDTYVKGGQRVSGIVTNIDSMIHWDAMPYVARGAWSDADMLQVCMYGAGGTPGDGMTLTEYRSHYAVWAILASPLILGVDVRGLATAHPDCLAMLLNPDVISVNQDAAALPPRLVSQTPPLSANSSSSSIIAQVFARPLSGGRLAVLLLNRATGTANLSVTWAELRVPPGEERRVYDVHRRAWTGRASGELRALVPSHDVHFVVLGAASEIAPDLQ